LQQDYDAARELYLESLELNAALGSAAWVAMEQHNLGWVELHLGNVDEHERILDELLGRETDEEPPVTIAYFDSIFSHALAGLVFCASAPVRASFSMRPKRRSSSRKTRSVTCGIPALNQIASVIIS